MIHPAVEHLCLTEGWLPGGEDVARVYRHGVADRQCASGFHKHYSLFDGDQRRLISNKALAERNGKARWSNLES
jgi:hypothetical protein